MKNLIRYAMIAFLATTTIAVNASAMGRNDTIEANEQAAWQAFKEKNTDAFKKLLSADMAAVYAEGPSTLAEELAAMQKTDIQSFHITDLKITWIDSETAVTTYKVDLKSTREGKDVSGQIYAGSVWRKTGDEWKAIFHSDIVAATATK